jgi:hypothetical protein
VAASSAGGRDKAAALSQQLIATRFDLYAIELQNELRPGMGTAGVKVLSERLKSDIEAYLAFQKSFFAEESVYVTAGYWGGWKPMVKSSSLNMLACGANMRVETT